MLRTVRLKGKKPIVNNFSLKVTSDGRQEFQIVMELVFRHNASGGRAEAFAVHPAFGMVLFWKKQSGVRLSTWSAVEPNEDESHVPITPLPYPMDQQASAEYVWNWLRMGAEFGPVPYIDGTVGKGWQVYTEERGPIGGNHYAIVGIRPVHAIYSK